MNYGLDYDGVIANTSRIKAQWLKENLGLDIPPWKTDRTTCLPFIGIDRYNKMLNFVFERNVSLRAQLIEGAIESINKLSKNGKIYVITTRPPERLKNVKEWLEKNTIMKYIAEIISVGKEIKQKVCEEKGIDVLIDDDLRHLNIEGLNNIKRILLKNRFNEPYPPNLPEGIEFARNWGEVMGLLKQ